MYSLKESEYREADLPVNGIIPLYDIEASKYHELFLNIENFVSIINIKKQDSEKYEMPFTHGLIVSDCSQYTNLLFKKRDAHYIRFLLKCPFGSSDFYFDTPETYRHISEIKRQYGSISNIICKYLLTAVSDKDGVLYDYFEAYAELV